MNHPFAAQVAAVAVEFTAPFSDAVVPRAAAAMNARQARAAGGEAADFSMYDAVGDEAHQVLFSAAATDAEIRAFFHADVCAAGARAVSRELCDASCDATLAELREKRARRRRRAAEAS